MTPLERNYRLAELLRAYLRSKRRDILVEHERWCVEQRAQARQRRPLRTVDMIMMRELPAGGWRN